MNGTEEFKVGLAWTGVQEEAFFTLAATVGVLASLGFSCATLAGLTYSEATVSLASVGLLHSVRAKRSDSSVRLVPGCFTKEL